MVCMWKMREEGANYRRYQNDILKIYLCISLDPVMNFSNLQQ